MDASSAKGLTLQELGFMEEKLGGDGMKPRTGKRQKEREIEKKAVGNAFCWSFQSFLNQMYNCLAKAAA